MAFTASSASLAFFLFPSVTNLLTSTVSAITSSSLRNLVEGPTMGIAAKKMLKSSDARLHPCRESLSHVEAFGACSIVHPHAYSHDVVKVADYHKHLVGCTPSCLSTD